jgi:hypothetical protein
MSLLVNNIRCCLRITGNHYSQELTKHIKKQETI